MTQPNFQSKGVEALRHIREEVEFYSQHKERIHTVDRLTFESDARLLLPIDVFANSLLTGEVAIHQDCTEPADPELLAELGSDALRRHLYKRAKRATSGAPARQADHIRRLGVRVLAPGVRVLKARDISTYDPEHVRMLELSWGRRGDKTTAVVDSEFIGSVATVHTNPSRGGYVALRNFLRPATIITGLIDPATLEPRVAFDVLSIA